MLIREKYLFLYSLIRVVIFEQEVPIASLQSDITAYTNSVFQK